VIDRNHYPLPQIAEIAKANRKIGLGVMGLAHFSFDWESVSHAEAIEVVRGIMSFIQHQARERSIELAEERAFFPTSRIPL